MTSRKLVVAHAGGASEAPPNTLEAFETAIRLGADMIEFDVRRTADDELVLYHDDAIGDRLLAALTYAEALRVTSPGGHPIPRFVELLDAAHGRVLLDIEIEGGRLRSQTAQPGLRSRLRRRRFRRDIVRGGRARAGQAREARRSHRTAGVGT